MTHWMEAVYRAERRGLFLLALSITSDHQRAEDAVHDAVTRVCRQRRPPAGQRVAYVYRAVRNAALDGQRRAQVRQASLFDEALVSPQRQGGVEEQIAVTEAESIVRKAIDGLSPDLREVVVLRLANGLSFRQMADVLDEPTMTVADRYHRALALLRPSLEHLA